MNQVTLGKLKVSAIGLGCMGMSQAYGLGHNEKLIGRVLKARRQEMVLATKFGIYVDEDGKRSINGHPDQVAARCDESLARLQTEVIDLYYLHRLDPAVPIEDTVGAMARLVEAGKIRHLGLSEISAATLRRAQAVHPITAVQSEYSPGPLLTQTP